MSNLNPGGSRKPNRVFGAGAISRVCTQALKGRDHVEESAGSIAARPHKSSREVERRLRQEARRKARERGE